MRRLPTMQTNLDKVAASAAHNPSVSKYDHELELRSTNNSHVQLLMRVPDGAEVLEIGCATGYMSEYMASEKACRVVGVDIDEAALEKASAHCRRTLCVDVESSDWQAALDGQCFDRVLCADLVEHLKEPQVFLSNLREQISEEGRLLASVPNGAHASIRLELLLGQLTYEDTGLLDRTHLHLYTQQSLMALFARAGYRVEAVSYTFHDIPDEVLSGRLRQAGFEPTEEALARLHAPDAIAYQYIVEARPLRNGELPVSAPELSEKPLRDSEEAYRAVHERLRETQLVAQRRADVIEAKARQIAAHEQHLARKDGRISEFSQQVRDLNQRLASALTENTRQQLARQQLQEKTARLQQQVAGFQERMQRLQQNHARLKMMLETRSWRLYRLLTRPVRGAVRLVPYIAYLRRNPKVAPHWAGKAMRLWRAGGVAALRDHIAEAGADRPVAATGAAYQNWIQQCEARRDPDAASVQAFVAGLDPAPVISIVMPVFEPRPEWLRAAIDSVLAQSYPHWQLCIADDASGPVAIREILEGYAEREHRIQVTFRESNGHISAASNTALALAQGDWVGFMDHDDLLPLHALYHVAREMKSHPSARLFYSDEDKIDDVGKRSAHYFKPDFNLDLMLSHNLLCHFSVYQRTLVEQVGGLREGLEGAQDYDLALRSLAALEPDEIRHIPNVLYHWRAGPGSTATGPEEKPYALNASVRAVTDYLRSQDSLAEVFPSPLIEGMLRVQHPIPDPAPLVSLIIPTRNGLRLLRQCIDSVRAKTDYPNYEILVVDNQSDEAETINYLKGLHSTGSARVAPYDQPFNFSAINNFAVNQATGDYLCFLNNDIEVIDRGWLAEMVSQAARPEIGAVGARLLYPDGRLQHGGVITGLGGVAGHAMKYLPVDAKGYNGRAVIAQNYSAVTAACMVVRREVFEQVGGFDVEHLGVAFNDVDLCLRIRELGYRNLWTPYAELYHHESASRGPENTAEKQQRFAGEIAYMKSRWGEGLMRDPAYNPNLTLDREDFSLNWRR